MQFFSALVEHLVVGVIALIWALPILNYFSLIPIGFASNKEFVLAIGVPVAYLVGMYIDVLASRVTAPFRKTKGGKSYDRTVRIISNSPDELARYLLQLSGREKIARGAFLNFFIAMICNFVMPKSEYSINYWLLLTLSILGFIIWRRLHALTDIFKVQAVKLSYRLNKLK